MKLFGIVAAAMVAAVSCGALAETITRTEYAGGPVMTYTNGVLTHVNGMSVPPPAPPPAPVVQTQVVVVQQYAPPPQVVCVERPRVVFRYYHQPTYCAPVVHVRSCESRVNVGLSVGIRFGGGHDHFHPCR